MKKKVDQTPATNANPVLSVNKNGTVLYSNDAGNLLLKEWGVKVGEKLPSSIADLVQKVITQNNPEKMEVNVGMTVYLIVFHPLPEQECVNISGFDISDQNDSEAKVLESEEKYRTLFNSIDEGFFLIDVIFDENDNPVDMFYVESNEAANSILGVDYAGKRLREIDPNYESYWYEIFGKVAKTGKSARMEQYADPDKKWYSFYVFKIGGSNSRRIGNIFQDITNQKKSEAAIKESEQLYKTLFDNTEDGFVLVESIFDEAGNSDDYIILKVNRAWEHQTGLKAAELLGKRIRNALPELEPIWPSTFGEVAKKGKSIRFESYNHNSNKWYDLYAFQYQYGLVGVLFKDITERKKAEEVLQTTTSHLEQAHNLLSGIIENTSDLIAAVDTNFRYLAINEAYHKECKAIYGVDIHIGDSMIEMLALYPEDQKNAIEAFSPVFQGKSVVTTQIYGDIGKSRRIYELHISPIYDSQGRIIGAAHINTEITERKRDEEALQESEIKYRDLSNTLEEKVKERTSELEQAYKYLREIDVVRKQEIHHRIKNNLQVISSLLDLQAEKFRGKKNIDASQILEAFKESQDRVISMALVHEELHKGGQIDTLNVSHYIRDLADNLLLTYMVGNNGIILDTDIEEDIFFDMDIAVPLGIIINELVSNSLKYAFPDRDTGEIQIKLQKEERCNTTTYVLSISDNGKSIPEDLDIEDLDSLGLQLVTTLVDQLDGELELKRNNGTEFNIRFTVKENNEEIVPSLKSRKQVGIED